MRRVLLILAVLAASLAASAVPPAAAADPQPVGCSGYGTTAWYQTAGGNLYESRTNVCVADAGGADNNWQAVVRKGCFRNNQPYGDGTGGCRWTSTVVLQADRATGAGWQDIWWNDWCYTCGGIYVQDSGRHWTDPSPLYDYFSAARGKSSGGQVRFYLADGSTVLLNESSRWGQAIFVPN